MSVCIYINIYIYIYTYIYIDGLNLKRKLICYLFIKTCSSFSQYNLSLFLKLNIQKCTSFSHDIKLWSFHLTHLFPMSLSLPPENIRKPQGFPMFSGDTEMGD